MCVNRDKVILVADDTGSKPKCELGWKPEPTLLNKGHACQKCSLSAEQEEGKCVCPYGYVFKDDGTDCNKNEDLHKKNGAMSRKQILMRIKRSIFLHRLFVQN